MNPEFLRYRQMKNLKDYVYDDWLEKYGLEPVKRNENDEIILKEVKFADDEVKINHVDTNIDLVPKLKKIHEI